MVLASTLSPVTGVNVTSMSRLPSWLRPSDEPADGESICAVGCSTTKESVVAEVEEPALCARRHRRRW